MARQNGQAVPTTVAGFSSASSTRMMLTRFLAGTSIHMWPPPPPQQSPRSRLRGSSITRKPGNRAGHLARRLHDPVVAPEVAGVVEGHGGVQRLARTDPTGGQQLADQHRVVDDLVGAAELGKLVLDRVEAVRAVRQDLLEAVPLMAPTVLLLHRLVEVLLAQPAADLGVAALLLHHAEPHARRLEDLDDRAGDRLVALVVGGRAAHPVEVFHLHSPARSAARRALPPTPGARRRAGPRGCRRAGCSAATGARSTGSAPSERAR